MRPSRVLSSLARLLTCGLVCMALAACVEYAGAPTTTHASTGGQSLSDMVNTGLSMQAERGSETLDITRMEPGGTRPSSLTKDSWTVFVYLCGSDLESTGGAATLDLNEMARGKSGNNVRFVVQTGGAKTWRNNTISPRQLGRYLVQNGSIKDVGSVAAANMGDASTLSDFLTWGVKNYPADHMALILWDHGGGSVAGVCFDERNRSDSLSLRELDQALSATFAGMWDKFEFVGFDACLMSTLETANVLATYSDYMVASQESEPGTGWEYTTLVNYLAKNPKADGAEVGKTLCNAYLSSLDRNTKGFATLAVTDLSKMDELLQDFYAFSQEMYASGEDQSTLAAMSRGIQQADAYGSNNRREGYTNMVDLGGIVDACAAVTPSASKVKQDLAQAVPYQVRGTYHAAASGLSLYYPLKVSSSQELAIFQTVAVNPSYLSYVDRLAHGATYNGGTQYQTYTNDTFFTDEFWNWLFGNPGEVAQQVEDNWDYVEEHTPASTQITFAHEPQVDDEGTFWFQLDQHGIDNAAAVSGLVYELSEDGNDFIALGETYDVYANWDTGEFADGFDGGWLSLPDGQNLNLCVERATEDFIVYSSPITLNGTECYLRLTQNADDGSVVVEGAWSGVASNGAVDRGLTKLKSGDVIVPLYQAFSDDAMQDESTYEGEPYTVGKKGLVVDYSYLPDGTYRYGFSIQDAFGDTFPTKTAQFRIDEDGTIYFD